MKKCSVDVCANSSSRRGFCNAHYYRWRRHGTPFGGFTAKGAPLRHYRETVLPWGSDDCLFWPFSRDGGGRAHVRRDGKMVKVCRLLCAETHGPPPTPEHQAAHSCGNGHLGCVTKRHLRWATHAENMNDMVAHGRSIRGSRSPATKITEDDVRQIRALRNKASQREIGRRFGLSASSVFLIQTHRNWAWVA